MDMDISTEADPAGRLEVDVQRDPELEKLLVEKQERIQRLELVSSCVDHSHVSTLPPARFLHHLHRPRGHAATAY